LDELSGRLFKAFDTDQNDLVDSLEFLSSLGILSGMEIEDKIRCRSMS
jgi:Ca2+-binding EF-hand superfamily protein